MAKSTLPEAIGAALGTENSEQKRLASDLFSKMGVSAPVLLKVEVPMTVVDDSGNSSEQFFSCKMLIERPTRTEASNALVELALDKVLELSIEGYLEPTRDPKMLKALFENTELARGVANRYWEWYRGEKK